MRATALLPGFNAENELEAAAASDPELLEGLAWGKPREGHPEGSVASHVSDLLRRIDEERHGAASRAPLRFVALVHDSFKYRVRDWAPKVGWNHHAVRARRFAERYTSEERTLSVIELHDRPYAIWRRMRRSGTLDERRFESMMRRVPDPALFLQFAELDGSTEGKRPEPTEWLRRELAARGLVPA